MDNYFLRKFKYHAVFIIITLILAISESQLVYCGATITIDL